MRVWAHDVTLFFLKIHIHTFFHTYHTDRQTDRHTDIHTHMYKSDSILHPDSKHPSEKYRLQMDYFAKKPNYTDPVVSIIAEQQMHLGARTADMEDEISIIKNEITTIVTASRTSQFAPDELEKLVNLSKRLNELIERIKEMQSEKSHTRDDSLEDPDTKKERIGLENKEVSTPKEDDEEIEEDDSSTSMVTTLVLTDDDDDDEMMVMMVKCKLEFYGAGSISLVDRSWGGQTPPNIISNGFYVAIPSSINQENGDVFCSLHKISVIQRDINSTSVDEFFKLWNDMPLVSRINSLGYNPIDYNNLRTQPGKRHTRIFDSLLPKKVLGQYKRYVFWNIRPISWWAQFAKSPIGGDVPLLDLDYLDKQAEEEEEDDDETEEEWEEEEVVKEDSEEFKKTLVSGKISITSHFSYHYETSDKNEYTVPFDIYKEYPFGKISLTEEQVLQQIPIGQGMGQFNHWIAIPALVKTKPLKGSEENIEAVCVFYPIRFGTTELTEFRGKKIGRGPFQSKEPTEIKRLTNATPTQIVIPWNMRSFTARMNDFSKINPHLRVYIKEKEESVKINIAKLGLPREEIQLLVDGNATDLLQSIVPDTILKKFEKNLFWTIHSYSYWNDADNWKATRGVSKKKEGIVKEETLESIPEEKTEEKKKKKEDEIFIHRQGRKFGHEYIRWKISENELASYDIDNSKIMEETQSKIDPAAIYTLYWRGKSIDEDPLTRLPLKGSIKRVFFTTLEEKSIKFLKDNKDKQKVIRDKMLKEMNDENIFMTGADLIDVHFRSRRIQRDTQFKRLLSGIKGKKETPLDYSKKELYQMFKNYMIRYSIRPDAVPIHIMSKGLITKSTSEKFYETLKEKLGITKKDVNEGLDKDKLQTWIKEEEEKQKK